MFRIFTGDKVFISMENFVRQQRLLRSKGVAMRQGCISREIEEDA